MLAGLSFYVDVRPDLHEQRSRYLGDATAKLASSGKNWYARQDSNLRPSA